MVLERIRKDQNHEAEVQCRLDTIHGSGWNSRGRSMMRQGTPRRASSPAEEQVALAHLYMLRPDDTDARREVRQCFGRSGRRALADDSQKANHRGKTRQLLNFFLAERAHRGNVVRQGLVGLSAVILRRTAMNDGLHANVGAAEDWSLALEFDGKPCAGVSPPGVSSAG